ncbi:MAG: hypothetical protein OXL68_11335 [Paracoccaceae bacterium]|nr:hypothetical protein [Paracoccaceae bacterium]
MPMSGETVSVSRNLLVRVSDGEGNAGWGEAASAPLMTGDTLPGMLAAVESAAPRIAGLEIASAGDIRGLVESMIPKSPGARCAVEMAVLDLVGRRTCTPLYEILGGRVRDSAAVLALVSSEQYETEVERLLQSGVRAFKVKVGIDGVAADLSTCHAVRTAVGRDIRVSADANGGFGLADALAFAAGAKDAGLDFIEQPLPASDLAGMAACVDATSVPIGADEGFRSVEDIRLHHEARAASGGSLKPLKMGVGGVLAAGKLMNALEMKVNLAGKVAESSVGSAAIAHLAVTLPQLDWDASATCQYLSTDLAVQPVEIVNGALAPSDAPGLGIEVDPDRLRALFVGQDGT